MNLLGIVGAGGFGREVMPFARKHPLAECETVFVVEGVPTARQINGHRVLGMDEFLEAPNDLKCFNVAIGDSTVRERIANRLCAAGAVPLTITDSTVWQGDGNELASGAVLCPFVTITSNAKIGRFFHANIYSYVAHDCVVGDFVTFAPGVKCNGNIVIEDHAYIGTGALLRQGNRKGPLVIGRGAVVGMGAVVTKDVPPNTTVIGNPARPLVR